MAKILPLPNRNINKEYINNRISVDKNSCWNWTLRKCKDGYARTGGHLVHRIVYELFFGEIPNGHDVDHLCYNRACLNPDHLRSIEADSHKSLTCQAMKLYCNKGHAMFGKGVYVHSKTNYRYCRACSHESTKEYRKRKAI